MFGARQSHTHSIGNVDEAEVVAVVGAHDREHHNVVLLALVVVNCTDVDRRGDRLVEEIAHCRLQLVLLLAVHGHEADARWFMAVVDQVGAQLEAVVQLERVAPGWAERGRLVFEVRVVDEENVLPEACASEKQSFN